MDEFLNAAHALCLLLLPILAVIVLILLIIAVYRLMKVFKEAENSLKKAQESMVIVDYCLDKAKAPFETVERLSKTVDEVHDATYIAVKKAGTYIVDNIDTVKDYISDKIGQLNTKKVENIDEEVIDETK